MDLPVYYLLISRQGVNGIGIQGFYRTEDGDFIDDEAASLKKTIINHLVIENQQKSRISSEQLLRRYT